MLERWSHYAALPLRIVLGCSFVVLGLQKLAGYFDGPGLARTAETMAAGGLSPGVFWAWICSLRLAALSALVALALLGPQRYALDLKSPRLASWSRLGGTRGPASKAA